MYILHKSEAWISTPLTQRKFSEKRLFFCLFRHRSKLNLFLCCICNSILHFSYIFAKSLAVKQQKAPASGIVPYVRAFFVSYMGHTNVPRDYRRAGIRSAQEKIPAHGWYPRAKELRGAGKKRRPSFRGKSSDIPMYCYEVLVFAKATQITAPARARFKRDMQEFIVEPVVTTSSTRITSNPARSVPFAVRKASAAFLCLEIGSRLFCIRLCFDR